MPSHRLVLDKSRSVAAWFLDWDDEVLTLKNPQGELVFEVPTASVHRIVDLAELEVEGKVSFATPGGSLTFKKNKDAVRDVQELIVQGWRSDPEYREALKHRSRRMVVLGLIMFLVCGVPFALYCWFAIGRPDPPEDSLLHSVLVYAGWLIHIVLLVLMAGALAGPLISFTFWRQLRRIRGVEQSLEHEGAQSGQ